ncbi:MAG: hypothetical protein AB7F96_05910 [Beijerinckiaceae bacterium]
MSQHAVIVEFVEYGKRFFTQEANDLIPLFEFEDELEAAVCAAGAGELDGHEITSDGSLGYIYLYGEDADALFKSVEPVLLESPVAMGCKVTLRYGAAGAAGVRETVKDVAVRH